MKSVSISLPEQVWRGVLPLIDNEVQSLISRADSAEGLYREIIKLKEKELTMVLEEIELNLNLEKCNAIN